MSAFIVSDKTLLNIVRYLALDAGSAGNRVCYGTLNNILLKRGFNLEYREHKDRLIKEMAMLNRLGVNERYNESEIEMPIHFVDGMPSSTIQVYKSLGCFLYQCCEGDIPETNDLYKMFEEIKNEIAHSIIHTLKEYDDAKWDN